MSFKKWLTTIFLTTLLLMISVGTAAGVEYYYDGAYHEYTGNIFKLKVNDVLLEPAMPPIVFSDYSVVPARAVFQDGLGADVQWDGPTQKVTVTMGTTKLIMTINKTLASINGEWVTMPIAPKIINDYTMIPARFVAENLGMQVDFDGTTDTISIMSEKKEVVKVTKVTYRKRNEKEGLLTLVTDKTSPDFSAFVLEEPTRLVLDVTDGMFSPMPSAIEVGTANLIQIRFGQQNEAARVVVDLTENLGYKIKTQGKNILLSIVLDPDASGTTTTEPSASPTPATPSASPEPEASDLFKQITYGYEGGRDYIKIGVDMGTPTKSGKEINIPIYGSLPQEEAEKDVIGFFGKKMIYTPNLNEDSGTLTVVLKTTETEMYVQGSEVRLTSVHKALPRSVMLDAGHGGLDGGAVAYYEDGSIKAKEKDFNLDIALRAQQLLEAQGVDVHMIRTEDVYVDFLRVGGIANDAGTSLFVSIHTNSTIMEQPNGIETYGYLEAGSVSNGMTSQRLSEILLEELIEETGANNRGVKEGKELAVINSTKMPATLIEIGFISNPEECEKMMTEEYRQKLAQAVCDGVLRAFLEMEI